ncbi:hypothetical protein ACFSTI_17280 [Rhizorhabdus histidinilytica]
MLTPMRHRGIMSATYLALTTLAAMGLGPTTIGVFSDHVWTNPATGLGYSILTVLVIFSVIGLLALIVASRSFSAAVRAAQDANATEGVR